MEQLSNNLLVATVLAYLVAMVGHAAEYAFGTRSHVGRAAVRPDRELVAVGAGGSPPVSDMPTPDAAVVSPVSVVPAGAGRAEWAGRVAVAFFALGLVAHAGTVVTRGLAAHRF